MESAETAGVKIKKDVTVGVVAFGVGIFCTISCVLIFFTKGISFYAILLLLIALFNYYTSGRLIGCATKELIEAINSYEYVETNEETKEEKE